VMIVDSVQFFFELQKQPKYLGYFFPRQTLCINL
jgi:hypothetical protein